MIFKNKIDSVVVAHNTYKLAGGEDAVVKLETELIDKFGRNFKRFTVSNDDIQGLVSKIKTTINIVYSNNSKEKMSRYLKNNAADLVHVHNFFPLLTPSIYDACIEENVPVVQTLHNYRIICPGALLMRKGEICEKCVTGSPYQSVLYGCYRNSRVGTLPVARMVNYHRKCNTWNAKVNRFIALTEFAKAKFVEAGFDADKISVKPNFIPDPIKPDRNLDERTNSALFVGRISQEKGITTLVKAWAKIDAAISIAGDGPLLDVLSSNSKADRKTAGIQFLGSQSREEVSYLMLNSQFLVMPSEWYEGFPMVLVEAFAHGLPVLASRLGGMAEIVEDGVTGIHFEAGNADDFAAKAQWMLDNPDECRRMGNNARKVYLEKYTSEKNHEMLMNIYEEAIEDLHRNNKL